jgi:ABC-type Mn2+/Zn2+ transport system permease subunit
MVTGVRVELLHYLLLVLVTLAIVASMKLVGIILVSALLVLPTATATQIASTYKRVLVASIAVAVISLVGGLALSYSFDLPSGATIVLCACLLFFVCLGISRLQRMHARESRNQLTTSKRRP